MESGSSAKSLLSLFSSSKLAAFTPPTSHNFYKTTPPPNASSDDPSPDHNRPPRRKKRRRRHHRSSEWTCAEIRALETYRNLMKGDDDLDDGLRDVLLPNRRAEEVKLQLVRIEETIREKRRGSKLLELREEENERFVVEEKERVIEIEKDFKRRRRGMDDILGLTAGSNDLTQEEEGKGENKIGDVSLDQGLGLIEETVEQRRKRELDEALGLFN